MKTVSELVCLVTIAALGLATFAVPVLADGEYSIPNVKNSSPAPGSFVFSATSRVVVNRKDAKALMPVAQTLAADLKDELGISPAVVTGKANPGDVAISLGAKNAQLGVEGYEIGISDRVQISGRTGAGVFYGTRTLLQYLKQSQTLAGRTISDWPDYPVRGLMVDVGRKYFTMPWLEAEMRDLSYLKLNTLHMHLCDNLGFRIQSETHPELNAQTSPIYSKDDIRALVALGQQYHIDIVPEIDAPSHADPILAAHPELRLTDANGKARSGQMDLSLPGTYSLLSDIIKEYLPLFPGPYFHAGSDEYIGAGAFADYPQMAAYAKAKWGPNANGVDVYINYVNFVDGLVRAAGKTTRCWEDPFNYLPHGSGAVDLNKDVTIELWSGTDPNKVIAHGNNITNCSWTPLYYVNGWGPSTNPKQLYETWSPEKSFASGKYSVAPHDPHLDGAMFEIWCDNPGPSENTVQDHTFYALRCLAESSWGAPKPVATYDDFQKIIDTIGRAPGVKSTPAPAGDNGEKQ